MPAAWISLASTIGLSRRRTGCPGALTGDIEIEIGERRLVVGEKPLPRQFEHGGEQAQIGDVGGADLAVDHHAARGGKVGHAWSPMARKRATFAARPVKRQACARGRARVVDRQHVLYSDAGATWRSGDAADCKSAYPGSIPGVASNLRVRRRFGWQAVLRDRQNCPSSASRKKRLASQKRHFATAVGFCYSPSAINDSRVPW